MIKRSFSVAAVLSAAAITGGVVFAAINPAQALPCPFAKNKGLTTTTGNASTLPSTQADAAGMDINKMGIIGTGMVAIAGLAIAGIAYKARLASQKADALLVEVSPEEPLEATHFPIPVPPEALSASPSEQETTNSTTQKDLTLVG